MNGTITLPRSVVEQALDTLDCIYSPLHVREINKVSTAMAALRAALEQPDTGNPVSVPQGWKLVPFKLTDAQRQAAQDAWWNACNAEMYWDRIYAAMLDATPQPPVVEQPQVAHEPVAWMWKFEFDEGAAFSTKEPTISICDGVEYVPLYTHPQPKREPLTEETIYDLWDEKFRSWIGGEPFEVVVKAIERAHGIGGEA